MNILYALQVEFFQFITVIHALPGRSEKVYKLEEERFL